jgi:hypothetical protein
VQATAAAPAAGPKVVRLSSASSSAKLQLEDVSDTLYVRPSLLADGTRTYIHAAPALTVSPAIAELIRGKMDRPRRPPRQAPCWSDCDCKVCHAWSGSPASSSHLYVHVQAPPPASEAPVETEDVVFIHGFISSSVFWTETVFPAFSPSARSRYRMFAVDLLGFGRSPKPAESLYTLREHVEMIERSVLRRYRLGSFHVVAHSLGSVLALALAVRHPAAVKSLTLLAPVRTPAWAVQLSDVCDDPVCHVSCTVVNNAHAASQLKARLLSIQFFIHPLTRALLLLACSPTSRCRSRCRRRARARRRST